MAIWWFGDHHVRIWQHDDHHLQFANCHSWLLLQMTYDANFAYFKLFILQICKQLSQINKYCPTKALKAFFAFAESLPTSATLSGWFSFSDLVLMVHKTKHWGHFYEPNMLTTQSHFWPGQVFSPSEVSKRDFSQWK